MARTSKYSNIQSTPTRRRDEWRAGLYIRLSKEDGDKPESESVSSQKALLEKFVSENPSLNFYDFYIDDGWSGTDFERPAFGRMIGDVTGGKINCVIVKDLSRFGRNYVEAGKYLETVFPLFGVRFIAVNDAIDSVSAPQSMNNVLVPFKNIINDEYCRDISVKVRTSLDIRRKQGKFIGSFAAYGYRKDENDKNKLVIDECAAATVRMIFAKFLSGYSVIGIARLLNGKGIPNPSAYRKAQNSARVGDGLWCDSTVRRILVNEVYIGNLVQKKNETISYKIHVCRPVGKEKRIRVENTHEAIVSREDFYKVGELLKRDTRTSPHADRLSLFSGFLKCADCGRAMQKRTVTQPNKIYDYYVCSTYKKFHGGFCTKHTLRADDLEEAVLSFLNKYISLAVDFDRLETATRKAEAAGVRLKSFEKELKQKQREVEKTRSVLLDLYPDYKSGILNKEQYFSLKERYENLLSQAESAVKQAEKNLDDCKNGRRAGSEFIKNFKKHRGLESLSREIICELIENINVREGGVLEIKLKFSDSLLAAEKFFGGVIKSDKDGATA